MPPLPLPICCICRRCADMCIYYSLQMSVEETEQLLDKLGIPAAESGGVPYNNLLPYLVQAIEGPQ